ncbi:MAG TPA: antibiotic biosynthesis monooxygenase, partial [Blastococcus sp.]|nr:antibiotic biosynthesis monooxygenase [Blastococcus sp.]
FEAAWRRAAAEISRVPGNLRQELIRDADDPRTFLITSDWTDRAAVDGFGRSSARETLTEALRDLREDASRNTYEVLAVVPGEQGTA